MKSVLQDGALAEKTTSLDFETVLSEASESRLGECDPLLIQDESLPSMPRPSSSVNVVPLPVAITPPLQPNDIPDEDESTLDAPETFEHQLQDFKKDFIEGKMINGALQKLDEVCDKFDRLTHGEDEYDHFGIYVVSLLRHCPYQQAILLQKKIINLILESQTYTLESGQMNEESPTHIFRNETSNKSENSKLHNSESTHFAVEDETSVKVQESSLLMDITPSATVMSQPLPICPTQSCELSELTRFSLSVQEDKSNGRGECRTFVDTSETHSHHLSDEFITNKNCIDDSLRKLDDMSEKFNMLDQKEHGVINFDHFGKYVASLLRRHPLGRAIVIEKKIIDFIWKAHVEPMLHVSGTI
ncbi:hypothetical protein C0J52_14038 [Blattella germanica]|nr:hypothetical protein C0J52_14038 [Blattella germanica]